MNNFFGLTHLNCWLHLSDESFRKSYKSPINTRVPTLDEQWDTRSSLHNFIDPVEM